MMIEELFEIDEVRNTWSSRSSSPDEKFVTEDAYENPKFVEDIVQDLAVALDHEDRIAWYQVTGKLESIHA